MITVCFVSLGRTHGTPCFAGGYLVLEVSVERGEVALVSLGEGETVLVFEVPVERGELA